MDIVRISLNNSTKDPIDGEISAECQLMIFRTPAIFRINGKEFNISGSSAVIYSGGFRREIRPSTASGLRYDMITFRMTDEDKKYAAAMSLSFNSPISTGNDKIIPDLVRSMGAHFVRKSKWQSDFMTYSMRLLFIAISEEHSPLPNDEYENIPRYAELKAQRDAIYDEPYEDWSVKEMSEAMGISRAYFHRLYQASFGTTCLQDIIESRMLYAAELLRNTNDSITDIAIACGYENDTYFMRQFKQSKGCTPTEYRRRSKMK